MYAIKGFKRDLTFYFRKSCHSRPHISNDNPYSEAQLAVGSKFEPLDASSKFDHIGSGFLCFPSPRGEGKIFQAAKATAPV
jgi:hypothetical protein